MAPRRIPGLSCLPFLVPPATALAPTLALTLALALPGAGAQEAPPPDGAPKVPIKLFAQLPRSTSLRIAPDGKHFVSIAGRDGHHSVVIRPLPIDSGKSVVLPPAKELFEFYWARWASNDRLLIGAITSYQRGFQGQYFWERGRETRMFSMAADGSDLINAIRPIKEAVTGSMIARESSDTMASIQDDVIDWLPDESNQVLVSIHDEPTRTVGASIRKVDVSTGKYSYLQGPMEDVRHWEVDRSGAARLGFMESSRGSVERGFVYRNPTDNHWEVHAHSPLLGLAYAFVCFDTDPAFAFVLGPAGSRRSLIRWNMIKDQPESTVFSDPDADVDSVAFSDDYHREVVGVHLEGGATHYFQPALQRRQAMLHAALPGMYLGIESVSKDHQQLIVLAQSDTEPGVYYHFDAPKRSLSVIAYAYDGLDPTQMAPVKTVKYEARDHLEIEALLTLPRGAPPRAMPTVVLPHGGPWAHDDAHEFQWLAQFLANRGYAVLQPNYRGSTGHGIAFERAGDRQWGLAMQDDITDGAQWLIRQGIADPARMCIVGGSYGGYAALMGAVKTPELFACAASFNGVSDLPAMILTDTGYLKDELLARLIGDPWGMRENRGETSPINGIDRIRIPILLVHARDDARVDYAQSERMYSALRAAHKPVQFVTIEKGDHWLMNEAARNTLLATLEDFLARNLQAH